MATRTDVTPDFNHSPRLAEVKSPSASINTQDTVDTLRILEQSWRGMAEKKLLNASGKEDLGGGTSVGITVALQNAQLAFESRLTPTSTGTVTTGDASGIVLTDSAATFISDGVSRGAVVINFTDESITEVLSVDLETQLTCRVLRSGSGNSFDVSDSYKVWNIVQCDVSGGNIVAVDDGDVAISPVFPTAFTQVIRTSSSSATIQQLEITQLQHMIESLRPDHSGFGSIYYWDPANGNDSGAGTGPLTARKTFASIHDDLITDGNNDVVFILPKAAGATIITERLNVTKSNIMIRGPGRDALFKPTDDTADTITVSGGLVEISGVQIETFATGTPRNALSVTGECFRGENLFVHSATGKGVSLIGGDFHRLKNVVVQKCGDDGFYIQDSRDSWFDLCLSERNGGWGFQVISTDSVTRCEHVRLLNCMTHHNGPGGLNIGASSFMTIIDADNYFALKSGNDIIVDGGSGTHNNIIETRLMLSELWKLQGLDIDNPMTVTPTSRTAGSVSMDITGDGVTSTTVTRQ